jgi:septal ring factor EnvC (AmiA/AmiB activator)
VAGSSANAQSSDVRNMTFIELMLLIAFIMIIMLSTAFGKLSENEEAAAVARQEVEALRKERTALIKERNDLEKDRAALKKDQGFLQSQLKSRVREKLKAAEDLAKLKASISALEQDRAAVERAAGLPVSPTIGKLGEAVKDKLDEKEKSIRTARSKLVELERQVAKGPRTDDKLRNTVDRLGDRVLELTETIREKDREIDTLKKKIAVNALARIETERDELKYRLVVAESRVTELERIAENATRDVQTLRFGKPLCLLEPGEEQAFLYRVTMRNKSFDIAPDWPSRWAAKVKEISGGRGSAVQGLNEKQFRAIGRAFYKWGRANGDCRFLVKVLDKTTNKNSYKAKLSIVEAYFFKREL